MKSLRVIAIAIGMAMTAAAGPIAYSISSNGNDHLYQIDLATGVAIDLGAMSFGDAEGLEFANGTLYGIGGSTNELWNLTTAPGTLIGSTGTRAGLDAGLGYNPVNGTMYNLNGSNGQTGLYTVNLSTGATTLVGTTSAFGDNLAIDGQGNAYAVDGVFADSVYSVNLSTGALSLIGGLGLGNVSVQFGTDFDGQGTLWALDSNGQIYTINTGTGAATFVAQVRLGSVTGTTLSGFEGLAIAEESQGEIPEPGTYLSVIGGLAALAVLRRRR
jgi:hypothetical protein